MRTLARLILTGLRLTLAIGACRIISMTFNSFARSITIKNKRLSALLIAYKNTWGIATSAKKRNKISLWGVFSYMVLIPYIIFIGYDFWVYFTTGVFEWCLAERVYLKIAAIYYMITIVIKLVEANKFNKGGIW